MGERTGRTTDYSPISNPKPTTYAGEERLEQRFVLFSLRGFTDDLVDDATTRADVELFDLSTLATVFNIEPTARRSRHVPASSASAASIASSCRRSFAPSVIR